jgi:DNA-binding response OmpR family regulator
MTDWISVDADESRESDAVVRCLACGVTRTLHLPFSQHELLAALDEFESQHERCDSIGNK